MAENLKNYFNKLKEEKKSRLGDKFIGEGTKFVEVESGLPYKIIEVKEEGFETVPATKLKNAKKDSVFVEFEEFSDKFNEGEITLKGFDKEKEEDRALVHMQMKDYVTDAVLCRQGKHLSKALNTKRKFKKGHNVKHKETGEQYIVKNPISKKQHEHEEPVLDAVLINSGEEVILQLADLVIAKEGTEVPKEIDAPTQSAEEKNNEVINLTVFVDNDPEMQAGRDEIYARAFEKKLDSEKLYDNFYDVLSFLAEKKWNKEFTGSKIKLSKEQRDEFAKYYVSEFSSWKYDNACLEDGGIPVETTVVTLYDNPTQAQDTAEKLMQRMGKIYEARPSSIQEGYYDVVLLKYKKKYGGVIQSTHQEFMEYIGLKRDDEVKFEGDDNTYTFNFIWLDSVMGVKGKSGFMQMKMLRNLREVNGRPVNIYDYALIDFRKDIKGILDLLMQKHDSEGVTDEQKILIKSYINILYARLESIKQMKFKDIPESAYVEGIDALKILIGMEDRAEQKEALEKELLELETKL